MAEKNALECHDYFVQKIMEDWHSFTEFVFSEKYCDFDFTNARARMEVPVFPPTQNVKYLSIKGYIDIFIDGVRVKEKSKDDGDCLYETLEYCIEVKSFIKSITETMRQINTHRMFIPLGTPYVVASPDNRYNDILDSQNLIYIELEKSRF